MFLDTAAAAEKERTFALSGLEALKRFIASRWKKTDTLSVDDLPESHYRDLGLPTRRPADHDPRPNIILGPM